MGTPPELQECNSIEQAVALINDEWASSLPAWRLAAEYAYSAADEAGYGIDEDNVSAHLEILSGAGAKFDSARALGATGCNGPKPDRGYTLRDDISILDPESGKYLLKIGGPT